MSETPVAAEVMFLWHHHQPDYRSAREGGSLLPWVRLHATKDYLDMALRLERHPRLKATFNFVPSLLDQLEHAESGGHDWLFDRLARPVASLSPEERAQLVARCSIAPRWALERWPAYRSLIAQAGARRNGPGPTDAEVLALEIGFLLAWLDPMFHEEPEARQALKAAGSATVAHRDGLLTLHRRLLARVIPIYRELARRGRVELSESAYNHPILPLLVNLQSARRARPDLPLPGEPFAAPEDAARQVTRAIERHVRAFGAAPAGMWPPEGSVSPEVVDIVARTGVRWLATDESVLWHSLPPAARRRESLYHPWNVETAAGPVAFFFRDRELSDRIGFVYQNWDSHQAADDLIARLRRIGREHAGPGAPLVSIILDGENCWESYPEDGAPFLDTLYERLDAATDLATVTPSEVLARATAIPTLADLHTGSWIDADFHIWIGHPEKNRAWELIARTRRALVESGSTPASHPAAWESLDAAEGSDWFWWFGEDHYTSDKALFDRLFREHLQAVHERAGLPGPAWLGVPVARPAVPAWRGDLPLGFVHPQIDGRPTHFYEWHAAGRYRLGAGGGSMHRQAGAVRDAFYGFDRDTLYVRLDFAAGVPGPEIDLTIEMLAPRAQRLIVLGLQRGERALAREDGAAVAGARCVIDSVLELAVPFASLGLAVGESLEWVLMLGRAGEPAETIPQDDLIRLMVPSDGYDASMWSA